MLNNENANQDEEGRVVIDAVHGRFRQIYVRCEDCNSNIAWDEAAIKNHFNNLHPSNKYCRYCKGKVFVYRKIMPVDDNETSQELSQDIVYHKCKHNEQMETVE